MMMSRERFYSKVYNACRNAHAGGCSYGMDARTIGPGWREAFARASTGGLDGSTDLDLIHAHDARVMRKHGLYSQARHALADARRVRHVRHDDTRLDIGR